jgi:GMP synthase-like glutamine amidotransferase
MNHQTKLNITVLQHSDNTPPGTLTAWLESRGHHVDIRLMHANSSLPNLRDTDWVIVLGGAMNVDDTIEFPWLIAEKAFLKSAVDEGKPCLGLCLGGQLLAQTLGGEVRKNATWEAGWFPVKFVDGSTVTVFQWHQDTFSLPHGAERLATNEITANQAFKFGEHVIGIQFHPESTREWVESFYDEDPYPTGPYVQQPKELTAGADQHLAKMQNWFYEQLAEMEKTALRRS